MIGLLRRAGLRAPRHELETARLRLVTITEALLQAEASGTGALGTALGVDVAPDWPPQRWEPAVRSHIAEQLRTRPDTAGWQRYVVLRGTQEVLVGAVGAFPGASGDVELGYSVVGSWQRKGVATEAVGALIGWLFGQPAVRSVSAQTYVTMPESVKVMERCGLRWVGDGEEVGMVRYRRWR